MFLIEADFNTWFWGITVVVVLIALLIYAWIYNDGSFDFEDFKESFLDAGWFILLIILVLAGIVYGFIAWLWWAMLLILIGIALIITAIVLIYKRNNNIVENNNVDFDLDDLDKFFDKGESNVVDLIDEVLDDKNELLKFTKADLISWCRENDKKNYSKLNKNELIDFIMSGKDYYEKVEYLDNKVE